jgi:hypothetical protein
MAEVKSMLGLLLECARNPNYLGRLMVSKAVLPFLQYETVALWAAELVGGIIDF